MENTQDKTSPSYPVLLAKVYFFFLLVSTIIFILAGRLNYWQGWLFCGTYLIVLVFISIMYAGRKDLLQERLKPGPGVKWWDKIIIRLYMLFGVCLLAVSVLDTGRFHWSPSFPPALYVTAYIMSLLSESFAVWALWSNKFFSSRVRIQTDRGHFVIQDGPYRFVRHPGYSGIIVWTLAAPLVLGSLWGLIPAVLTVITIIIRTYLEDTTLKNELPGYADYASKVRYLLIPGLW